MYCVLVSGMPAAGKTTLARYLSGALNLPLVSKDGIKEQLYDDVGFRNREEKGKLGTAAMNIMYYIAQQMMACGQGFILENNFEDCSRPRLMELLERYGYTAVTVSLEGDYRAIYRRFVARNESPERHRGHVVNDGYPETEPGRRVKPMSYEAFVADFTGRGMDRFTANGPRIVVDATDSAGIDREALLEKIKSLCNP